jgi:hypothetical protein
MAIQVNRSCNLAYRTRRVVFKKMAIRRIAFLPGDASQNVDANKIHLHAFHIII